MTPTSWWIDPDVQATYSAFIAARDAELPRMQTDRTPAARYVDALVTAQFSMGFPRGGKKFAGMGWQQ